jgi:hypothetical protein
MPSRRRYVWPLAVPALLLAIGCEEPRNVGTLPSANSPPPTPAPAPAQPKNEVMQPRAILNQRTTDIRDADVELKKGAKEGSTKITARDPITLGGNAYVTMVGRTSILQIESTLKLWQAEHDRYPKDFKEFYDEIIKANNIALSRLPYYQEYGYDAKEHKLIILEYPDRKEALQKQDDARYGR